MDGFLLFILGVVVGNTIQFALGKVIDKWEMRRKANDLQNVLPISADNQNLSIALRPSLEVQKVGMNGKSKRGYTHSSEVIALQRLSKAIDGTPISLNFQYSSLNHNPMLDWIILGLSRKSEVQKELYSILEDKLGVFVVKVQSEIAYEHQYIRVGTEEYKCLHELDEEYDSLVVRDYGLIARIRLSTGNFVLLCGGIHMYGTQVALETAINPEFINFVKSKKAEEFCQIVEVSTRKDGLYIEPTSIRWKDLPFRC